MPCLKQPVIPPGGKYSGMPVAQKFAVLFGKKRPFCRKEPKAAFDLKIEIKIIPLVEPQDRQRHFNVHFLSFLFNRLHNYRQND